ncbi:diguanylate cyclase (GGDEF)-like protein [Desulfofundulus luciae]|uniref:Diguanylate cyclase (GGDEF)-like protein n=1 Tax=Desulfofundulus luciae TaxID=74702 RepID=A0ABU0AYK3_9FIRM|nr:sensor domain-containing diguanylate cyclase [Desulfofundulus luciae]MDQ0285100.1 diguanylate cyclase (GGDEF)-like protein [Desulfofundulus luciae]
MRRITHVAYTWLVIGLGAWGLARLFSFLDLDYGRHFLVFIVLGVAAEWLAVNFPHGRLSGGFALVLATFILFDAPAAAWTGALATLISQGFLPRGNPLRAVFFNAAQHVLAVMAGNYVFLRVAGAAGNRLTVELAAGLLAFSGAYFLVNHLLVSLYVAPRRSLYPLLSWWDALRWDGFTCLFSIPIGLLMAFLYREAGLSGVVLLFLPVLVVQFVLRLYVHMELVNRELLALYHVARGLSQRLDVQEMLDLVLKETRRVVSYHSGVIYLWSEDRRYLEARAAAGPFREKLCKSVVFSGEGFIGWVLENGEPEIVHDVREDPRVRQEPGLFQVLRSLMVIPLSADTGKVGVLVIGDKRPFAFNENHLHTVSVICGQAAMAIANAILMERLAESANTDGLTGIYNHRYFTYRADVEYRRTRDAGLPLALIMLDVDNFKLINDRFGHVAGDAVLVELAGLLRDAVGEAGVVCRYGGEEFAVLLPGYDAARAGALAGELRRLVREHHFAVEGMPRQVRISLGVAACPRDAVDVTTLVQRADQALYGAKKAGKDRVMLYEQLAELPR